MELINGKIFNCNSENLKLVRFENKDQIVMRAAMAILSQMKEEGYAITYVIETNHRLDLMMTETAAAYFEGQLTCSAFYEHVKELTEKRDHILDVLNSLADERIGDKTWSDTFVYKDGDCEYSISPMYNKDGSINVRAFKELFNSKMHQRSGDSCACAEYDYDWGGKASKMYKLFSKEIFNLSE